MFGPSRPEPGTTLMSYATPRREAADPISDEPLASEGSAADEAFDHPSYGRVGLHVMYLRLD